MHLYIIGFMGSGKSTLFEDWKDHYNGLKIDFDTELASRFGVRPDELGSWIESFGWQEFRRKESELLKESLLEGEGLHCLGGGAFSERNLSLFRSSPQARTLWLNTPVEVCWERVKNDNNRPLVKAGRDEFFALYREREILYSKANYSLSGEGKWPSLCDFWKKYRVREDIL